MNQFFYDSTIEIEGELTQFLFQHGYGLATLYLMMQSGEKIHQWIQVADHSFFLEACNVTIHSTHAEGLSHKEKKILLV